MRLRWRRLRILRRVPCLRCISGRTKRMRSHVCDTSISTSTSLCVPDIEFARREGTSLNDCGSPLVSLGTASS